LVLVVLLTVLVLHLSLVVLQQLVVDLVKHLEVLLQVLVVLVVVPHLKMLVQVLVLEHQDRATLVVLVVQFIRVAAVVVDTALLDQTILLVAQGVTVVLDSASQHSLVEL
jgi:hypothetical protein